MSTAHVQPLLGRLFSPLRINRLELPNRVLMSSLHLNLDDEPDQYRRAAGFYALRAQGGVGLIVTAGAGPNAAGKTSPSGFGLDRNDLIPPHRDIVSAVHRAGGRIALQILHFGREAFHGRIVSASPVRLRSSPFTPRALDEQEIERTVADFADCAGRALEAGYDAIELIFSQGFLVHQFLAPACNRRTDRWGGSFENRSRLAREIAARVRARVGADFPLIFRIPCMDLLDGGLTPAESVALIEQLRPFGIDLLNVSIGWHESSVPTIAMTVPRAAFASAAAFMRRRFPEIPVAVSNRINDPRVGEQLLRDGVADVIAMGRPFLADPHLLTKARGNRFEQINTCIGCNQNCLDYVFTGRAVGCSVNPDCGLPQEGEYPPLAGRGRIAVAGGGIAGMGAALFLARRGAQVTLFEPRAELGGQLRLAARIPGKAEFAETIRYFRQAILDAAVEVRLGRPFDAAAVQREPWDHAVIAVGGHPRRPAGVPGLDLPHVVDYLDVLEGGCPVNERVVVIGGGGVACDLAKFLAHRARRVRSEAHGFLAPHAERFGVGEYLAADSPRSPSITLLGRSTRKIAYRLGRTTRWIATQELERYGVVARTGVDVLEILPDAVRIRDRRTGAHESLPAGSVILATGQEPGTYPARALAEKGIPFSVIGAAADDGGLPGNLSNALKGAYDTAMALR